MKQLYWLVMNPFRVFLLFRDTRCRQNHSHETAEWGSLDKARKTLPCAHACSVLRGSQPRVHQPTSSSYTWTDSISVQKGWGAGSLSLLTLHSEPLEPPNYSPIHSAASIFTRWRELTVAFAHFPPITSPLYMVRLHRALGDGSMLSRLVSLVKANK